MPSAKFFPEGLGILHVLARGTDGEFGKMFDLSTIPPKQLEIERKYEIPAETGVDRVATSLIGDVAALLRKSEDTITWSPFAGLDQYWVVTGKNGVAGTFRYRFGSNRPPELTAKVQLGAGGNERRGEFDLDVRDADAQNIRAFMSTICAFADESRHFCVHQAGDFWKSRDQRGRTLEVVVYKAGRLGEPASRVFAEIEAKRFEKPDDAIEAIEDIEKQLLLVGRRQTQSFAELFG